MEGVDKKNGCKVQSCQWFHAIPPMKKCSNAPTKASKTGKVIYVWYVWKLNSSTVNIACITAFLKWLPKIFCIMSYIYREECQCASVVAEQFEQQQLTRSVVHLRNITKMLFICLCCSTFGVCYSILTQWNKAFSTDFHNEVKLTMSKKGIHFQSLKENQAVVLFSWLAVVTWDSHVYSNYTKDS